MAEQIGLDRAAFRPSYRPERRPAGTFDPDMMRMGVIAAGAGGVLALLIGGAMLLRPAHHGVPVIEADPGPVRIKPENPGGMQVTGADLGGPAGVGPHLAPAAEQPELQVLHQQLRQMQRQIAKQAADNAQALKLAEAAAARPKLVVTAPVERASATAIMPAPEKAAPPLAVTPPADDASSTDVQLAAFTDAPAANAEWDALVKRNPGLLGGRRPVISRADAGGRVMWRLRTGGFATVADAAGFCDKMRAKGEECSIAAF